MLVSTVGQLLIDEALPESMRGHPRELTSKGIKDLLQDVATNYPEEYRDVSHKLMTLARDGMYFSGGYSFGLKHMLPAKAFSSMKQKILSTVERISTSNLDEKTKHDTIIKTVNEMTAGIDDRIFKESMDEKNPLALQIHSGAKGKPFNLKSIRGGDLFYEDHRGNTLSMPVVRSYAEGLSPAEYWAGTYGARKGIVDLKKSTQDAGYFGKQLMQAAHRLLVTVDDYDNKDPDTITGLPVNTDDPDNEGALLAHTAGPYGRNTVLTPKILNHLKELGHDDILVRSPMVSGPADGGVASKDVGIRERAALAPIGDFVGIAAAASLAEPISQAQIGCLEENTEVRMADWSTKRIKDIQPGDMVLGACISGYTFPVKVNHVFDNGIQPVYNTKFESGYRNLVSLHSTQKHKILATTTTASYQVIPVDLKTNRFSAVLINSIYVEGVAQIFIGDLQTYDIEVDHPDHLFVLANGLIVSNSKHTGGVAGAGKGVSGFKVIDQLVQVPKVFPGGATHSQQDGTVQRVEPAPGGGYNVFVNGERHYVSVDNEVKVKPGDQVEAGDELSTGLTNPAEVVKHKGLGEGRKTFIRLFQEVGKNSGFNLNRRNIELVARGLLNHVKLNDQMGDYVPNDVVPYNILEHNYEPRPGFNVGDPASFKNQYLEKPALHYTIGTKLRPSVVTNLKKFGVNRVTTHQDAPTFEPVMVRGVANLSHDPDWMTQMLGSQLEKGLLKATHAGKVSDESGTSYVASLARGVDFGTQNPIKGFDPDTLIKQPTGGN